MSLMKDLKNCRIIIRNADTGKTLADSIILSHDLMSGQIEIDTNRIVIPEGTVVSSLIFSPNGLFESHGTVGVKEGKKTCITLYEGTERNGRQAVRYQVNIQGDVDYISREGEGKLPGGFPITLLNMSSIGLLLQVPKGRIEVGDVIRFSAVSKGQRLSITAKAARVENAGEKNEKIGCSIQLVNLG